MEEPILDLTRRYRVDDQILDLTDFNGDGMRWYYIDESGYVKPYIEVQQIGDWPHIEQEDCYAIARLLDHVAHGKKPPRAVVIDHSNNQIVKGNN